jgi:molybdopterin converting factor small subunit
MPIVSQEVFEEEPAQSSAGLRKAETPEAAGESGGEVQALREELASLREDLDRARRDYEQNLASRDHVLDELKQQVSALAKSRTSRKSKTE